MSQAIKLDWPLSHQLLGFSLYPTLATSLPAYPQHYLVVWSTGKQEFHTDSWKEEKKNQMISSTVLMIRYPLFSISKCGFKILRRRYCDG